MTADDEQNDDALASLVRLKAYDVSERHARRLRRRCHAALQPGPRPQEPALSALDTFFRRVIAPVLGGVWCLTYLVEILRRAAAIYGLPP